MCLENNVVLKGRYKIEKLISVSEFSIVYLGYDKREKQQCVIKEFYPNGKVLRDLDGKMVVYKRPSFLSRFYEERDIFLNEAQIIKKYRHKNIVEYIDHFIENETGYIILKKYKGKTLDKYIQECNISYVDMIKKIFIPIVKAVTYIHKKRIIHRDIKPGNIIVDESNKPIIIDFGSAVNYKKDDVRKIFYTPGFSPLEFYSEKSKQGKYSDVYSIAATMYYCLTRKIPKKVSERVIEDKIEDIRLFNKDISDKFSKILMKSLSIDYKKRPSSLRVIKFAAQLECIRLKIINKDGSKKIRNIDVN
ncbi:UNVERIFIED_CONTAM: serine/threonine protein kinase [Acetivibrio alkalicellulosi]